MVHRVAVLAYDGMAPFELGVVVEVFGLARPERDFTECVAADEVVIEGLGWIEGAFDGELEWLPLPLTLRSLPNALGVVTPRETALPERSLFKIHGSRTH